MGNNGKFLLNRRKFLGSVIASSITLSTSSLLLTSCTDTQSGKTRKHMIERLKSKKLPLLPDFAVDGSVIKVGLVGCGGQGVGDLISLTKAANNIQIVALGDVFQDKIDTARELLKQEVGCEIPAHNCFIGFDAYQKVINSNIDLILLITPPAFRPMHFEAAVRAGKHVFMEKPLSVDVAGSLKMLATSKIAESQQLKVVTGTQYRHQRSYVEAFKQIANGLIGEIVGGECYYNQGMLWYRNREKGWSDMEWMLRDWVNWCWLSGDHIVEQHIHNLDVFSWFSGLKPVTATGFGARQRRVTGDQYDMFSVDFIFENNVHLHSMCRQIDGCSNNISNIIHGTHGTWFNSPKTKSEIIDLKGNVIWSWDFEKEKQEFKQTNPYILQFVELINAIRKNEPLNQTEDATNSSLIAIMGRQSAYSGQTILWEELKQIDMNLLPDSLQMGSVDMGSYKVPVPGIKES